MAIIDTEPLIKAFKFNRQKRIDVETALKIIEAQPPAKAIPLDWLMEYMSKTIQKGTGEGTYIVNLVREWRKENEAN